MLTMHTLAKVRTEALLGVFELNKIGLIIDVVIRHYEASPARWARPNREAEIGTDIQGGRGDRCVIKRPPQPTWQALSSSSQVVASPLLVPCLIAIDK